jgi:hypothetical protein
LIQSVARAESVGKHSFAAHFEKTGMSVVATEERKCVSGVLPGEIWEATAEEWRAFRATRREQDSLIEPWACAA